MLIACWSSKGGAGTTVVAAGLALLLARSSEVGALLVDLAGDGPAVLGLPEPDGPGVAEWLRAGVDVPLDALPRLEQPVVPGLALLPRGRGTLEPGRADVLTSLLTADARPVIADCGAAPDGAARTLAAGATRSVLVTRPCYLALRRALVAPIRPSEVVLLTEPGRSLTRRDVEECVGAPVVAEVAVDPLVARAVDAGLLAARLPKALAKDWPVPPEAAGDVRHLVDAVHRRLLEVDPVRAGDRDHVVRVLRAEHPLLPAGAVQSVAEAVTARAIGLGPLDPILQDPAVTEVMVNGRGPVWIERHGRVEPTDLHLATEEVSLLIERILAPLGLRADRVAPVADARLADGSRVNVVVPPLAVDGACITIRRFGARAIALEELCPPGVGELLTWAAHARSNIVVSGGTGAGKTTVLNAIGAQLPPEERLVTVEDTAELRLPGAHVVRLEARPATADGLGAVNTRDLVRNALRMRPDRIIVGEVRGPEAVDMLWAMNTGHEGSLSTCHANSTLDALRRLEVMVLSAGLELPLSAVRDQLTSALDLLVHVARLADGGRGIVAVAEVVDQPADGERVRPLADRDGLHSLPARPIRRVDAPAPDPGWCR